MRVPRQVLVMALPAAGRQAELPDGSSAELLPSSACCGRTTPTGSPLPCGPTVIPLFRREPCHQGY
jgi:hypothetical protein